MKYAILILTLLFTPCYAQSVKYGPLTPLIRTESFQIYDKLRSGLSYYLRFLESGELGIRIENRNIPAICHVFYGDKVYRVYMGSSRRHVVDGFDNPVCRVICYPALNL